MIVAIATLLRHAPAVAVALRLAAIEAQGITREELTAEDIADNLDEVMAATNPRVCGLDMPEP